MRTRSKITIAVIVLLALALAILSYATRNRQLVASNGKVRFERNELEYVKISVQNPRKVGRQYFTSLERNTQASEKSISTPIEVFEYEVFALICCTVSSEPSIFQATFDKRGGGFSGFLGGYESKWIDFYPVDLIVAGSADSLLVPLHEGISKYVFLLKANTEVTGWRIFEVDSKSMSGAIENGLIIPDLTKLPKADSHVLQSALTPIIKEADDYLRKNFAGNLKVP